MTDNPLHLTANSVLISSRDDIYNLPAPYEMSRKNPEIIGQIVTISLDDTDVRVTGRVTGVERSCLSDNVPIRKDEQIGLRLEIIPTAI